MGGFEVYIDEELCLGLPLSKPQQKLKKVNSFGNAEAHIHLQSRQPIASWFIGVGVPRVRGRGSLEEGFSENVRATHGMAPKCTEGCAPAFARRRAGVAVQLLHNFDGGGAPAVSWVRISLERVAVRARACEKRVMALTWQTTVERLFALAVPLPEGNTSVEGAVPGRCAG